MNCYSITNPAPGQECQDDVLGALTYNGQDGTWEKMSTSASDSQFQALPTTTTSSINWTYVIIALVAAFLVYYLFFK